LDGDTLAIGASTDDELGLDAGAVYLFARQGEAWQPVDRRFAFDAAPQAQFGYTLELAGDELLVGAWRDNEAFISAGAAYVISVPEPRAPWLQLAALGVVTLLLPRRRFLRSRGERHHCGPGGLRMP
jgi:hypothetical protein